MRGFERVRRGRRAPPMQAVILAAGLGSRLGPSSTLCPKCLIEVGGASLLAHHLQIFKDLGIREVCVVVGHLAAQVRLAAGPGCTCIENTAYARTNSLVSLWMTRRWVRGPMMLVNGDVLAHPAIYARVASAEGNALAYDSSSGHDPEHMKVEVRAGRVVAISKGLGPARSSGENVGVLKFDAEGAAGLLRAASGLVAAGGINLWAPAAVDAALRELTVQALDVADLPWVEIDYAEDLAHAQEHIWPHILAYRATGKLLQRRPRRRRRRVTPLSIEAVKPVGSRATPTPPKLPIS